MVEKDDKAGVKNGSKEAARPKDEVGPYVPDKRGYFAGLALQGIMANAALHRSPNAPAFALQMADLMLEEMRKPLPLPDEELKQQLLERKAEEEEKLQEQRRIEAEADAKREKEQREREKKEAAEREKAEKAEREKAEREKAAKLHKEEPARAM